MRAALALALASSLLVVLAAWLLWPDAATAAPGSTTDSGAPAAGVAEATASTAPGADAAAAPAAATAPEPGGDATPDRQLAAVDDDGPPNVRVVRFGSDVGVPGIEVRSLRPLDWQSLPTADREEYERLSARDELFDSRFALATTTRADGTCRVPLDTFGTQVCARSGELFALGYVRAGAEHPTVLALRPDRTLRVLVVDAAGRPAPGIEVQARRVQPVEPSRGASTFGLGQTDENGRLLQRHVQTYAHAEPNLLFDLCAIFPGGESQAVRVDVTEAHDEVVLHLPPAGTVIVHVRDAAGAPIDVAFLADTVTLASLERKPSDPRERDDLFRRDWATSSLDAHGDARFPCVALDGWVYVRHGSLGEPVEHAGPTLAQPTVEITLREGAGDVIVTGRVVQPDGAPFASRQLGIKCSYDLGFVSRGLRTDADGRMRCNLGSTVANRTCFVGFTTETTWSPRDETGADGCAVELPPRALASGTCDLGTVQLQPFRVLVAGKLRRDEGVRQTPVMLEFERKRGDRWQQEHNLHPRWQPDGSFVVHSGTPAGEPLRITVRDGAWLPVPPIECTTGATDVEIALRAAGSVAVTLVVDDTVPLDRLTMQLVRVEPPEQRTPQQRMSRIFDDLFLHANENGRAGHTWNGLLPGTYRLTIGCQGGREPLVTLDALRVASGPCQDPRLTDIDLRGRVRTIEVRATGPDGADVASVAAFVVAQAEGETWRGYNLSRGVAKVAVSSAVDLLVLAPGCAMARANGVTASCRVPLQPAATAKLQVELPKPLPDGTRLRLLLRPQLGFDRRASIQLDTGRGMPLDSFFEDEATTGDDGSCEVPVRWPGEYAFEGLVQRGERERWSLRGFEPRTVTLPAAGTTTLRVREKDLDQTLQRMNR